jgi:hypothetical protein
LSPRGKCPSAIDRALRVSFLLNVLEVCKDCLIFDRNGSKYYCTKWLGASLCHIDP